MIRRLLPVLFALLAIGLFAAGCGDDDDDSGDTTTAAETTVEDTTSEDTTTEDTADTGDEDVDAAVAEARDQCKQAVATAGTALSSSAKADLDQFCDELDSTDPEELEAAAREVCVKIIEDTVPEGAARDQAVQQCETAGITP